MTAYGTCVIVGPHHTSSKAHKKPAAEGRDALSKQGWKNNNNGSDILLTQPSEHPLHLNRTILENYQSLREASDGRDFLIVKLALPQTSL